jgi:hypothetical protein
MSAEANARLNPYDELKSQLDIAFEDALRKARVWMTVYLIIRSSLIVFSVLTSADAVNTVTALSGIRPVFGIIVALLAAFDAWLKPDVKYRIHYLANDNYTRLARKLSRVPPPKDPDDSEYIKRLEQISDEYDQENEKYSAALI